MTDVTDEVIARIQESVLRAAESLDTGSGAILRQHLSLHQTGNEVVYSPAVLLNEMGGTDGHGAATALALLIESGRLFLEIEEPPEGTPLTEAWGMPRTLNAGDAFYALARDRLDAATEALPPARRVQAASTLEAGARAYAEALAAGASSPANPRLERAVGALYPLAYRLVGILTDADAARRAEFDQLGAMAAAEIGALTDEELGSDRIRWLPGPASTPIIRSGDPSP